MSTESTFEVCLINMPYSDIVCPSIALGLLQAQLQSSSISCKSFYPNLHFANKIGVKLYSIIAWQMHKDFLFGDWTFGRSVFNQNPGKDKKYALRIAELIASSSVIPFETSQTTQDIEAILAALYEIRDCADTFVDEWARRILSFQPKIVGCTSSLQQHLASVALLKRIHELSPDTITVIGGANSEGGIGEATHRSFPWIDYSVSGEADTIIAPLFHAIIKQGRDIPTECLPEVVLSPYQRTYTNKSTSWEVCQNLDELPLPEYRDYYNELKISGFDAYIKPSVVMESSRGCWWAMRNKCTFCGLNNPQAGYRSKSPKRFLKEVEQLGEDYDTHRYILVDNIIDMSYFKTVLPQLQSLTGERRFFFETKANLNKDQVRAFKDAGVYWIQPGIESLHTEAHKLMQKGCSSGQIIQLMKWTREYGIRMIWLFLWGFPGEKEAWYEEMAEWIPMLEHLEPPKYNLFHIQIQRHSHYFEHFEKYEMELAVMSAMPYVYQLDEDALQDLSYCFIPKGWKDYFENPEFDELEGRPVLKNLESIIFTWQERYNAEITPILAINDNGSYIDVKDTRHIADATHYQLSGDLRKAYLICDKNIKKESMTQFYKEMFDSSCSQNKMQELITELKAKKLILEIDGRLIALGVHGENAELVPFTEFPGATLDVEKLQADGLYEKMSFF